MAPSKLALFLALSMVLLAAVAHGCESGCPTPTPPILPPVVPTPPILPPILPPVVPTPSTGRCAGLLKLKVCANVLNLVKLKLGVPKNEECCPLLHGLADLDAALCLCTAIKANVLGINLNVPVDLTLLLNQCGKKCPANFTCPK